MPNLKPLQLALTDLTPRVAIVELALLAASLAIAYGLVWLLRGAKPQEGRSIWFGVRLYDGVLFGVLHTRTWGTGLIWIAAVLTIWSMVYYLQKALPEIRARVR